MLMAADEFYDVADLILNYPGHSRWGNLGYWQRVDIHRPQAYAQAASALAEQLATRLELSAGDSLLDVGFGCGQQFEVWQRQGLQALAGINVSASQLALAQQAYPHLELKLLAAEQLASWADISDFKANKIVALDCAYHFTNKPRFIEAAYTLLPSDGCLVLSDLCLGRAKPTLSQLALIKGFCRMAHVPYKQWQKPQEIPSYYRALGFSDCQVEDIGADVLVGFGAWYRVFYARNRAHISRSAHLKFRLTAAFLDFLSRHRLASYVLIRARK